MATSKPVVRQVDMEALLHRHAGARQGARLSPCGFVGQADMLEFALTRTMRAPACLPGGGSFPAQPLSLPSWPGEVFRLKELSKRAQVSP